MGNIVLTGMPGAGKSTVGVVLAKKLGYTFLDTDLIIQERESRLLHEIIGQDGLDAFLKKENEVNAALEAKNAVIATGGSVVYGTEAMAHLASIGTVIYLKLGYNELESRLGNLYKRGVAMREGQTLSSLYEERIPLYEKYADITIDCSQKSIREVVQEIARWLYNLA